SIAPNEISALTTARRLGRLGAVTNGSNERALGQLRLQSKGARSPIVIFHSTTRRRYGFMRWLALYAAEKRYHRARRHDPAAFSDDTAKQYGAIVPARGALGSGKQEDLSMDHRLVYAPARPAARAVAIAAATTMLTALIGSAAMAQT